MNEIAGERADVKAGKINVDEQPELAGRFGVMSIPTLMVLKNGKVVSRAMDAQLPDVRTHQEYQAGRIPDSQNVPLRSLGAAGLGTAEKDAPLFVYCRSGARSRQAVGALARMGFTNAKNIGGIAAYHGKVER